MTESGWLTATDPWAVQQFLAEQTGSRDRKWRLFAAACCRHVLDHGDHSLDDLIPVIEGFADGRIDEAEFVRRREAAIRATRRPPDGPAECVWSAICGESAHAYNRNGYSHAVYVCDSAAQAVVPESLQDATSQEELERHPDAKGYLEERRYQADWIRDIFGNPFRPITAGSEWLTPTVVSLAEAIYRDRAFDRLPVLADAIEEAGCDNADLLAHCRGDGPHALGCWAVDLLLGKS